MSVRYYLVPLQTIGSARGPLGLRWRFDESGLDVPWAIIPYGRIGRALLAADVTPAQHNVIAALADVVALPLNVDTVITGPGATQAASALEGLGIPGHWVSQVRTYRELARVVTGIFLYMQRLTHLTGANPLTLPGWSLDTVYNTLPQLWRNAMLQAAIDLGYSTSEVTAAATIRQILKYMADQLGDRPISFGNLGTL